MKRALTITGLLALTLAALALLFYFFCWPSIGMIKLRPVRQSLSSRHSINALPLPIQKTLICTGARRRGR